MESAAHALPVIQEYEVEPLPFRSKRSKNLRRLWGAVPDDVWLRIFDDMCLRKRRILCSDNIHAVKVSQVCRRLNELFRSQYVVSVTCSSIFFFPQGKQQALC